MPSKESIWVRCTRLLQLGVHPNSVMAPAGSPLTYAVDEGNLAAVKLLLAYAADPDLSSTHSEGSPLDHARVQRRTDMSRLLGEASKTKRRLLPDVSTCPEAGSFSGEIGK